MWATERLTLRHADATDAGFLVALLNDPGFLEFIGDRGVRTEADALGYLARMQKSYADHGFGMYVVQRRDDGARLGLCGLVRRDGLDAVDLGFAFLPAFRRAGYAAEAATWTLAHARTLGHPRVLAICSQHNVASRGLLERLGFALLRLVVLPQDTEQLCLYERA